MKIEIKMDKNINESKIIIHTSKITKEITEIYDKLNGEINKKIKAFKDDKMYFLNQSDIESIYAEESKVYIRYNNEKYLLKLRLYEIEELLDKKTFVRISHSEIINIEKVKNIDFRITGTILFYFYDGNKAFVSRRYIKRIKNFLNSKEWFLWKKKVM